MIQIDVKEAKAHFAEYLAKVAAGEMIVICKNNKPFVKINPIEKPKPKKRILGSAKGSLTIAPNCFESWPKKYLHQFHIYRNRVKSDPLFWKP